MRRLLVTIVAACSVDPDAVPRTVAEPPAVANVVEPPPIGVPHAGLIQRTALTDRADAAVSLDSQGGVRVWPTLDGTREPVAIAIPNARGVAITQSREELLVAILDTSASVRLVRVSRTGVIRGSSQIAGDVAIEQLVAVEDGVLVARRDRSIERYDAKGLRGRITLEPGEELGALAARHGGAAVLVGPHPVTNPDIQGFQGDGELSDLPRVTSTTAAAEALRWIDLSHGLAWGPRVKVPAKMQLDELALSPNHQRFAVVSRQDSTLHVVDASSGTPVHGIDRTVRIPNGTRGPIGFIDDDHAVRVLDIVEWWVAATADPLTKDPWKTYAGTPATISTIDSGAIADGLIVWGHGANLAMQSSFEIRYLGWRDPAAGELLANVAAPISLSVGERLLTLDRSLQRTSEVALPERFGRPQQVVWLDANHAVLQTRRPVNQGGYPQKLELVDLRSSGTRIALAETRYVQRIEWNPELRTLGFIGDGKLRRFRVDLDTTRATELPVISFAASIEMFRVLDPSRANGASVFVSQIDGATGDHRGYWLGAEKPIELRVKDGVVLDGSVGGVSPTGAVYVRANGTTMLVRDAKTKPQDLHLDATSLASDPTGRQLVALHAGVVTMIEPTGAQRWKQSVWDAQRALFSPDGTRVVIETRGGFVSLDTTTGARTNVACGYGFGIMTKPPEVKALTIAPVCEDPGT